MSRLDPTSRQVTAAHAQRWVPGRARGVASRARPSSCGWDRPPDDHPPPRRAYCLPCLASRARRERPISPADADARAVVVRPATLRGSRVCSTRTCDGIRRGRHMDDRKNNRKFPSHALPHPPNPRPPPSTHLLQRVADEAEHGAGPQQQRELVAEQFEEELDPPARGGAASGVRPRPVPSREAGLRGRAKETRRGLRPCMRARNSSRHIRVRSPSCNFRTRAAGSDKKTPPVSPPHEGVVGSMAPWVGCACERPRHVASPCRARPRAPAKRRTREARARPREFRGTPASSVRRRQKTQTHMSSRSSRHVVTLNPLSGASTRGAMGAHHAPTEDHKKTGDGGGRPGDTATHGGPRRWRPEGQVFARKETANFKKNHYYTSSKLRQRKEHARLQTKRPRIRIPQPCDPCHQSDTAVRSRTTRGRRARVGAHDEAHVKARHENRPSTREPALEPWC